VVGTVTLLVGGVDAETVRTSSAKTVKVRKRRIAIVAQLLAVGFLGRPGD
jgi:hypothetical protein